MSSKRKNAKKREDQSRTYLRKDGFKIPVHFPDCDCYDHFHLNLAGLTNNLNFELLRCERCVVEIDTTLGATVNKVKGKIMNVGIDFIDLKKENGMIVTILKDKISQIHWLDDDCNSNGEDDLESELSS